MIGLDTNILVRYLTLDDDTQATIATRMIETQLSVDNPGFIGTVVLCELVWVLESRYGHTRHELAPVLWKLLAAQEFRIQDRDQAIVAVQAYETSSADFADVLLGLCNKREGCGTTWTFDKAAARLPTHTLLN